jgi:alkylation response protein AidB-like acyl-CoA dehydrogenase
MELTPRQQSDRAAFRAFVEREIAPYADDFDRRGFVPDELIRKVAREGYTGLAIPEAYGGGGRDVITLGLLHEEVGRGCSSVRSLLTVHGMVAQAVLRWGGPELRNRWLPPLARGELVAAYGLSEPNAGSDAQAIETRAEPDGDYYVLNGHKRWISFGQVADVFLVFARCEGRPATLLVERGTPGLQTEPITGMLGTRASMLAEVRMNDCRVPRKNLVGREGLGLTHVLPTTLDFGRYSVAWGCVGIAQGCLEACVRYASERKQFGSRLLDHQPATGRSMFVSSDYRDWPLCRLHSPRAERMTEKSPITPSAISVQTKKKPPPEFAMPLATPTPFPFMWMTGTANERSEPRNMMTYPERRPASTSVPYSQTTEMSTPPMRFESPPGSIPRTMSSVR